MARSQQTETTPKFHPHLVVVEVDHQVCKEAHQGTATLTKSEKLVSAKKFNQSQEVSIRLSHLTYRTRGSSIMEHNPTQIIGSTHNSPKLVAGDAVIEHRESECSRKFTAPYLVVTLLKRSKTL
jgi:hypothetical protein